MRSCSLLATRFARDPAQPAQFGFAEHLALSLAGDEIVTEHVVLVSDGETLMVVAVAVARIGSQLRSGEDYCHQQDAGDEEEVDHRSHFLSCNCSDQREWLHDVH